MIYDRIEDYVKAYNIHYNTWLQRKNTWVLHPLYNQDWVMKWYVDIYEMNLIIAQNLHNLQNSKKSLDPKK